MQENRASATAEFVAMAIIMCADDKRLAALVPSEMARLTRLLFANSSSGRLGIKSLVAQAPVRRASRMIERVFAPGVFVHFALRKLFIEREARASLAAGTSQLVVIGAGLDTLALRLARELPEQRFFEIDHPASLGAKRRALDAAGETLPGNLRLAAADLATTPLVEALRSIETYDPRLPTLFIAEGLIFYLPIEAVRQLFRGVHQSGHSQTRFAFSYLIPDSSWSWWSRANRHFADRWLKHLQEPFRSTISRSELESFVKELGFELVARADATELRRSFLTSQQIDVPNFIGEDLAVVVAQR